MSPLALGQTREPLSFFSCLKALKAQLFGRRFPIPYLGFLIERLLRSNPLRLTPLLSEFCCLNPSPPKIEDEPFGKPLRPGFSWCDEDEAVAAQSLRHPSVAP